MGDEREFQAFEDRHGPAEALTAPLDCVPVRSDNVLELDMGDGVILYSRDSDLVHHLNPSAGVVWQLCDGTATVAALAADIAAAYGLDPTTAERQVAGVVAEFETLGLVDDRARRPRS